MLSASKLLCGDEDFMTDGLAMVCVATCYFLSIESWLAVIGLITVIPAKNSIEILLAQRHSFEEE
mgnify:FL=1